MLDILIVGAGPHALSLVSELLEQEVKDPYAESPDNRNLFSNHSSKIQDYFVPRVTDAHVWQRIKYRRARQQLNTGDLDGMKVIETPAGRVMLVDKAGSRFMATWDRHFSALDIPHLRSTIHQHPEPTNQRSLMIYAQRQRCMHEITDLVGQDQTREFHGPFLVPSSQLFRQFIQHIVIDKFQVDTCINCLGVHSIRPMDKSDPGTGYRVEFETGKSVDVKRVVLAIGMGTQYNIPDWASGISNYPSHRLMHYNSFIHSLGSCSLCDYLYDCMQSECSHRASGSTAECSKCLPLKGQCVLIVGGGQTALHLLKQALNLGARKVKLMTRNQLRVHAFDLHEKWMGPQRPRLLMEFWKMNHFERLAVLKKARTGGATIMPASFDELKREIQHGRVDLLERCEVLSANWMDGSNWNVAYWKEKHELMETDVDWIWLATGMKLDFANEPLVRHLHVETVDGLPVLSKNLCCCENIHVMGAYAALELGPGSLNLMGARSGAFRIAQALTAERE